MMTYLPSDATRQVSPSASHSTGTWKLGTNARTIVCLGAIAGAFQSTKAFAIDFNTTIIGEPSDTAYYLSAATTDVNPVVINETVNYLPSNSINSFTNQFGASGEALVTPQSTGVDAKSEDPNILIGAGANTHFENPYHIMGNSIGVALPLEFNFSESGSLDLKTSLGGYSLATASYNSSILIISDSQISQSSSSVGEQVLNGQVVNYQTTGNIGASIPQINYSLDKEAIADLFPGGGLILATYNAVVDPTNLNGVKLSDDLIEEGINKILEESSAEVLLGPIDDADKVLSLIDVNYKTKFTVPAVTVSSGDLSGGAYAQASMIGSGSAEADFLDPLTLESISVPADFAGNIDGISVAFNSGLVLPVIRDNTAPTAVDEPPTFWLLLAGMTLIACGRLRHLRRRISV